MHFVEDEELIQAYREGDESALADLVERYTDRLFAFAYRLSGDRTIAEDAVQDAFVKVWKNIKKFDGNRVFKPWVFSITRNATIDIIRTKKDIHFTALDGDDDSSFADTITDAEIRADAHFDEKLEAAILEEALRELPSDSRAVVMLHDKEGMTFEEIGKALKKPLNTVKSRYRRALIALQAKIKKRGKN